MPFHNADDYLSTIPLVIPDGKVIVHNRVPAVWPVGLNGFRIWLQNKSDAHNLIACDCGWAAHLGAHYRVFGSKTSDDKLKN